MSNPKIPHIGRREFMGKIALAAGIAPVLGAESLFDAPQVPGPATSVRLTRKRVLEASDFVYLGCMRTPAQTVDLSFASGAMTARKVNGKLNFFITQRSVNGEYVATPHALAEVQDTGNYRKNPLEAPRTPIVQNWGDIYQGKRQSWMDDGTPIDMNGNGTTVASILYREGRLYWAYNDWYNVTGRKDWHLGMTVLNNGPASMRAYGPWRTKDGVHKLGGNLVAMPDSSLGMSATISSGSVQSPWGPMLKAGVGYPTESTPAGRGAPDLIVPHRYVEHYYPTNDLTMEGTLKAGGTLRSMPRTGDYVWHLISSSSGTVGASRNYLDPLKNNGQGSWTECDVVNGIVYIDLPTKYGVLFMGSMATGHTWYGLSGDCGHGIATANLVSGTGPNSSSYKPWWGIYDPAKMAEVVAGRRGPMFQPDVQFDPNVAIGPIQLGPQKTFGGAYFDAATSRLYVLAKEAEQFGVGMYLPLIHVFQLTA